MTLELPLLLRYTKIKNRHEREAQNEENNLRI
jgi:hypothetical protein